MPTLRDPPLSQTSHFRDNIKEPARASTVDLVGIVSRPLIITVSRGSRQRRWVGHSVDDDDDDDAVTILLNNSLTDLNGDKNCALNPYSNNCYSSTALPLDSGAQMRNANWRILRRMPVNI